MQTDTDLPTDVVEAIQANRKIDAIKRLREHRGVGLKEAKQEIEGYILGHPQPSSSQAPKAESSAGRLILIAILIGGAYVAYQYFS
jgi:ribosomal protein L7/L12